MNLAAEGRTDLVIQSYNVGDIGHSVIMQVRPDLININTLKNRVLRSNAEGLSRIRDEQVLSFYHRHNPVAECEAP